MAIDYDRMATLAQTLITENGRTVTFRKFDRTPEDVSKPWRGPDEPRGAGATEVANIPAVFMDSISSRYLGISTRREDNFTHEEAILIVASKDVGANEVEKFDEVDDGTEIWSISDGNLMHPGTTKLILAMLVRKKGKIR